MLTRIDNKSLMWRLFRGRADDANCKMSERQTDCIAAQRFPNFGFGAPLKALRAMFL